jgi:hypothetical protein
MLLVHEEIDSFTRLFLFLLLLLSHHHHELLLCGITALVFASFDRAPLLAAATANAFLLELLLSEQLLLEGIQLLWCELLTTFLLLLLSNC